MQMRTRRTLAFLLVLGAYAELALFAAAPAAAAVFVVLVAAGAVLLHPEVAGGAGRRGAVSAEE